MEMIWILIHPWQGLRKGWINFFLLILPQTHTDKTVQHSIYVNPVGCILYCVARYYHAGHCSYRYPVNGIPYHVSGDLYTVPVPQIDAQVVVDDGVSGQRCVVPIQQVYGVSSDVIETHLDIAVLYGYVFLIGVYAIDRDPGPFDRIPLAVIGYVRCSDYDAVLVPVLDYIVHLPVYAIGIGKLHAVSDIGALGIWTGKARPSAGS